MTALLDEAALVDHEDVVRRLDRREPVGDHEGRAAVLELLERLLDLALRVRVERPRGLVEDQDLGVLDDRARDREALPLAAREQGAALAHDEAIALLLRHDLVVELGGLGRGLDLGVGRVEAPVADVLPDRVVEDEGVLRHDRDLVYERLDLGLPQIDAIDRDPSLLRIVEARHEVHERRLAAARRADDRRHLARPCREAHVLEDGLLGVVAERHVLEADRVLDPPEHDGVLRLDDLGLRVEDLEDAVHRRGRVLERVVARREGLGRHVHHEDEREEGSEAAEVEPPRVVDHERPAREEDDRDRDVVYELHPALGGRAVPDDAERRHEVVARPVLEALHLVAFAAEGLDDTDAREHLLHGLEDVRDRGLAAARAPADALPPDAHGDEDREREDSEREREPEALPDRGGYEHAERDRLDQEVREDEHEHGLELRQVVREAREELAPALVVEVADREREEVLGEAVLDVHDHARRERAGEVVDREVARSEE